jgi:hypothetical protein
MRTIFITLFVGLMCLLIGLCVGAWQAPQLQSTKAGQWIASTSKVLWSKGGDENENSQFESYQYPTIKWRARALPDGPESIVRLWTTYEAAAKNAPPGTPQGTLKYRLTLFKATNKDQREVQMLDSMGFKLMQFNANDFHNMPGAPEIVEARDSIQCSEDQYKKARDYSVK